MLIASLAVLVLIVGLLIYGYFVQGSKASQIGYLMIAAALFAICFGSFTKLVTLVGR